jgi:uncharacterized protein
VIPVSDYATIDCDVHCAIATASVLMPYFDSHWPEYAREAGFTGGEAVAQVYPPGAAISARSDAAPPEGGPAGSSLELLRSHVLEGVDAAVMNCYWGIEQARNPDFQAALATAVNRWLAAEWLDKDSRLRASIVIGGDPAMAADEIDRAAEHPGFVQVLLPVRSERPYGNRSWHPVYEAAVRNNLVLGLHAGGVTGHPFTQNGWPTFFLEEYVGMSQAFQSQILSLIAEGVFGRFPELRVALLESGFTWIPSLMWRLDKEWKGIRREVPWVSAPPSELIRRHFRATIGPLDAPKDEGTLARIVSQIDSDDFLLYSSDYPHAHTDQSNADAQVEDLLNVLSRDSREKLMSGNARSFYNLYPD